MLTDQVLTTIGAILIVAEIFVFAFILIRIKLTKSLTFKDTSFYPFIFIIGLVLFTTIKFKFGDNSSTDYIQDSILGAFEPAIKMITLEFNVELIGLVHKTNLTLHASYVILCFLSAFGFVSLFIAMFKVHVMNWFRRMWAKTGGLKTIFSKEHNVVDCIFSTSDQTKLYLENLTLEQKRHTIAFIDKSTIGNDKQHFRELKSYYYSIKVPFAIVNYDDKGFMKAAVHNAENNFIAFLKEDDEVYNFTREAKDFINKNVVVLKVNTDYIDIESEKYKKLITYLHEQNIPFDVELYKSKAYAKELIKPLPKYKFYLIGSDSQLDATLVKAERERLFHHNVNFIISTNRDQNHFLKPILADSHGYIRSYDKYELNAQIFIQENNMAKHIRNACPEIFNENKTIKDCDINLFMIGFGKVNKAILEKTLISAQFVTEKNGHLYPKELNAYIYDQRKDNNSIILSTGIFNYKKSNYKGREGEYFELPRDYSNVQTNFGVDLCDGKTIEDIKRKIKNYKKSFNFFVIALGSDFRGAEYADKLSKILVKDENHYNFIFVSTKNDINEIANTKASLNGTSIHHFGFTSTLISRENVVQDKFYECCIRRHYFYQNKHQFLNDPTTTALCKQHWNSLSSLKRESNVSSISGIPFKLSLLGYDDYNFDIHEYYMRYNGSADTVIPERKTLDDYNVGKREPRKFTIPDVFAFMEHERWNAFEFSQSTLPLSKAKLLELGGKTKTDDELFHANLTTDVGLTDFYYFMHQNNLCQPAPTLRKDKADVFKHDYKLMDDMASYQHYLQ